MSDAKHTPGPWRAVHRFIGAGPHDDEVAGLGWEVEGPPEPDGRGQFAKAADAHLIAAAPDLLAACELALKACQENIAMWSVKNEPILLEAINALRPAIAKATNT